MAIYQKQHFENFVTTLTADHLNHIEDGIVNATVIPNPELDGSEIALTSLQIGVPKEQLVTRRLDMAYGAYTSSSSIFSPETVSRANIVLDVKAGDIIALVDSNSSYQFLVYKLIDGTTTFESNLRPGYSADNWTSQAKQRIIIVAKDVNKEVSETICTPDELLDILKITTTESAPILFKIDSNDSAIFQEELNLSRCDFGKEMEQGINYYVEGDTIVCKCTVSSLSNSMLKIFTAVGSGVARGSAYFINFETGMMGMYGGIAATTSTLNVKYQKAIGFSLIANREYVIECRRQAKEHIITITDAYSLQTDTLTVMPTGSSDLGEHWGKRSYASSGGVTVNSFKNYSLQPYECRLLIIGDSFIEGATGFENHANRYCTRMKRLLNGSCAINGFGGATTEQVSGFYEAYCKTLFKPDYVLIACGTNNRNYNSWLTAQQALISSIKTAGSIPVLVTITRRLDNDNIDFIRQANEWIRNQSGELYIDINRITTTNYDGETQNASLFAGDKVHPLPATHALIVQKALLDVPEVFNLPSSYINNRAKFGQL